MLMLVLDIERMTFGHAGGSAAPVPPALRGSGHEQPDGSDRDGARLPLPAPAQGQEPGWKLASRVLLRQVRQGELPKNVNHERAAHIDARSLVECQRSLALCREGV